MLSSSGMHDLHALAEVAERLPHRVLGRGRARAAPRSSRSPGGAQTERAEHLDARPWCGARRCPSRRRRAPCPRRRGRTAPSAARGGSSSWACAGGSRAASGRARRHHRASAARGSSPGGRGRCPSGATASRHHRATSARVFVLCVPARAAASCAVTTWCMTAMFGSMPNRSSGTSTVPAPAPVGGLHVELHAALPARRLRDRALHRVAHEHEAAVRARAPRPSRGGGRARRRPRPPRGSAW